MRTPIIIVLAALAVAGLAFAFWPGDDAGAGAFEVRIDGPDGLIWNGSVDADPATAYTVLLAASDAGGFEVTATGSGDMVFVASIAGYRYAGSGGWCFATWSDGAWVHPVVGANAWPMQDGDALWWHYETDGCPAG